MNLHTFGLRTRAGLGLILLLSAITNVSLLAQASATPTAVRWEMHELATGVYASIVAPPTNPSSYSNSLVVVQSDHVVVVDTRDSPEAARLLIDDIRELTDKPVTTVINTHWHSDHVNGNETFAQAFPGLSIVAHPEALEKLSAEGPDRLARIALPTDTVRSQAVLDADEREIRIIHPGPAHTDGDLVVYLPEERLLMAGDLIEQGFPYFGHGSVLGSAWALDRLSLLDVRRILPSHARLQQQTDLLTDQRAFLRALVDVTRRKGDPAPVVEPFRLMFTEGNAELDARFDAFVAELAAKAVEESDTLRTVVAACGSPEHRAFDFWVGSWEVTGPAGNVVGHNRIESTHGGCMLRENWTGATGSVGQSLNSYDRTRGVWHQTWVDNSGLLLLLDGQAIDGGMRLEGEIVGGDGSVSRQRITWTIEADDGSLVRQLWEASTDGGATWSVAFDGLYRRN